jgi:hypothetical protein
MTRFLRTDEYESLLMAGLKRYGLAESDIRALLDARWPLFDISVLTEAQGRGIVISMEDVQGFLDALIDKLGVAPFIARETCFEPHVFDEMLEWCIAHGRGVPTLAGELMRDRPRDLQRILQGTKAGCN